MASYGARTYAELVQYASETDSVVYIDSDIDIMDEYPDGDMPSLTVNGTVEGNGFTISNWYHAAGWVSNYINFGANGVIKNLKMKNIYCQTNGSYAFVGSTAHKTTYFFEDCEFTGIIVTGSFIRATYVDDYLKHCSVNLLLKNNSGFSYVGEAFSKNGKMDNCYVKIKSESTETNLFKGSIVNGGRDSYFEIETDHFYDEGTCSVIFENCVFDITTDASFTFDINSNVSPSILRVSHAPHATCLDKMHDVTEEHWLDASYLKNDIGFNIIAEDE